MAACAWYNGGALQCSITGNPCPYRKLGGCASEGRAPMLMTWIDAAERLPSDSDYVLVATRSKNGATNVDKGYYDGRWVHRGMAEVSHWMPLPEPPEVEAE